jgi:hypothetical protein
MPHSISPSCHHDAAWIITLWRALHGGDPTPADVAAEVIANLTKYLPEREGSFGIQPLPSPKPRVPLIELECDETADDEANDTDTVPSLEQVERQCELECRDPREFNIHHYYFKSKGVFYRLDRPAFACLPTAA